MSSTLNLTDGVTVVSLLSSAGFYLAQGGYAAVVATENEFGEFDDVTERFVLTWNGATDDQRDSQISELQKLAQKALYIANNKLLGDAVWLEAATHSETYTRYSLVRRVTVGTLDPNHWGPAQSVNLTIDVVREGLWRDIPPNSTSYNSIVTGETVYTYQDTAGDNYIDVTCNNLKGDAPALTHIRINNPTNTSYNRFLLATKSGYVSNLNNFNPFFHANVELDNVASQAADSDAPNNINLTIGGSSDVTLRWTITAANVKYYSGRYQVFLVAAASSDGLMTARVRHGNGGLSNDYVPVNNYSSALGYVYLGLVTVPDGNSIIPNWDYNTTYDIYVDLDKSGSVTATIYTLIFVPADEQVFECHTNGTGISRLYIDGIVERSYYANSSDKLLSGQPANTYGPYLKLRPLPNYQVDPSIVSMTTRIYFFNSRLSTSGNGEIYYQIGTQNFAVNLKAVYQYTALRGNDA